MEKQIDALTGVRAVAVLLVFLAHLQQRYFSYEALDGTALSVAPYFGITTFLVLSGFVIHWNYGAVFATERPAVAWWKFFVARFGRLYPLHFAVSLLAVMWLQDYGRFAQHVFMVQTWFYQGQPNISYYNTWSISIEWFFYFVYAAGYPLIARWTRSGSVWLLVGVAGAAFSVYWIAGPVVTESDMWLRYAGPYLRVLEFLTGVVAAQIVMTRRAQGRGVLSDAALVLAIALTMALYNTPLGQRTNINYVIAPMVAVALIVISDRRSFASSALSARWLLWIGDRSYSIYLLEAIYLVHSKSLEVLLRYESSRAFTWTGFVVGWMFSAFGFALVLVLSGFCWRYFEMPARTVIKRALSGGLKSSGQPQSAPE